MTGARWLAGVGVLLLAAAGVAMLTTRWDALSDITRLLIMVAGTGLTAGASRLLQPAAPTTSMTLTYLTTILVALDIGALAVVGGAGWPGAALACGLAGLVSAEAIRQHQPGHPSNALSIAAGSVAVGGLAALTSTPATLLAVALVGVALLIPSRSFAVDGWAGLIAIAPLVQVIDGSALIGQGTLADMGLLGGDLRWSAPIAGIGAAAALSFRAYETRSLPRVVLALVSLALGGMTAWLGYHPPTTYLVPIAAAGFVGIQLLALFGHRYPAWGRWTDHLADLTELVAAPVLSVGLLAESFEHYSNDTPEWTLAIAAFLTAIGWLIGTARLAKTRLGPLVPAATMIISGAMLANTPAWIIGAFILGCGLVGTAYAIVKSDGSLVLWAGFATTVGGWVLLVDLQVAIIEAYVVMPVLAVLIAGEIRQLQSWAHWAPALTWLSLIGVVGHQTGSSSGHTTFVAAVGAIAAIYGAIRRRSAPLFLGTVMAIVAGGYQVLDATVGVAGWGWLALGGTAMVAVAALLERNNLLEPLG